MSLGALVRNYEIARPSGGEGIRIITNSPRNTANPDTDGAESGALAIHAPNDPALATLMFVWPTLPNAIRAGILAMVGAAGGSTEAVNAGVYSDNYSDRTLAVPTRFSIKRSLETGSLERLNFGGYCPG